MKPFEYLHAVRLGEACEHLGDSRNDVLAKAGGVDLLDLMKEGLVNPRRLVHLRRIDGLSAISRTVAGVQIGALVTLHQIASSELLEHLFGGLVRAAALAATPQIRNVATVGGNLCQRNRCWYFRRADFPCLRKGGDRCFAEEGENRYHAIFGDSFCHAVHPSSLAPMLVALGARATVQSAAGEREISLDGEFFRVEVLEGSDVPIAPGEVISQVTIPSSAIGLRTAYQEVRERRSFDWALSSTSVALRMDGAVCRQARVVLGSVAPVPWRALAAERLLEETVVSLETVKRAARAAIESARPMTQNEYKVPMTRALVERTLLAAAAAADGSVRRSRDGDR